MEQFDAADRSRAERVAVIRVVETEVDGVLRRLFPLREQPVLKRDLERRLDGGRAVVGEEHVIEAARRDLDQPPRERRDTRMRRAEQRRVREAAELIGDRRVDRRHAMAEQVAPERRRAVEQAPAAIIDQVVSVGIDHDERLGREVLLHLGERMPHVLRVPPPDVFS